MGRFTTAVNIGVTPDWSNSLSGVTLVLRRRVNVRWQGIQVTPVTPITPEKMKIWKFGWGWASKANISHVHQLSSYLD
jgi:hypothetical protein